MHLRHLTVVDFRSWRAADVRFEPGPVVLVGANGQGKTNLVEAIAYLATLGSHRVSGDAPLIRTGAERALVRGAVVADARELRLELEITAGRANRARLNGATLTRPRDLLGALRTVLFAPEDLAIVRGDPSERRRFLDELIVARRPSLAGLRSDYDRVLKQRAALLKSAGAGRRGSAGGDLRTLDVWDGHLAVHGAQLMRARLEAVRSLRPLAGAAYQHVAPTSPVLGMHYATSLAEMLPQLADAGASDPGASFEHAGSTTAAPPEADVLEAAMLAQLAKARPAELERGVNLVGPHRDDLELRIGSLPVRGYASHGEGWSVALALRLASYELLRADALPGGDPVLILDDVFAELDADRRAQLSLVAGKAEQAIVTAAVIGDVPEQLLGARYDVHDGEVRRV